LQVSTTPLACLARIYSAFLSPITFTSSNTNLVPSFPRVAIMAAQFLPLSSVSSVLHGAVCISPINVPRLALELSSPSSQAFQSSKHTAAAGGFGRMKAYGPNSSSSATTVVHAQLQVHLVISPHTIPLNL